MAFNVIQYNGKALTLHKSVTHPMFEEKTVLVTDTWEYVDFWLKRASKSEARFYWEQAHAFYEATLALPSISAPLTAYYCFLNATKALLLAKGSVFGNQHGVSGYTRGNRTSLSNEVVKFQPSGILPALATHLGEAAGPNDYLMYDLLYNLVYIHRAFDLTYSSAPELFVPIHHPKIVRSTGTHEAWFVAELKDKYRTQNTLNRLSNDFQREHGSSEGYLIRFRHRFNWRPANRPASINRYRNYHQRLRKQIVTSQ